MHLELQRLLARGPGTLPADIVVDVGALLRAATEDAPGADALGGIVAASKRSTRTFTWLVAPTNLASSFATAIAPGALPAADVVASTEPVSSLLAAGARTATITNIAIVTANVERRSYELSVLAVPGVIALLDIVTGEVWTAETVREVYGLSAEHLPLLEATVGAELGERSIVRVPHLSSYRAATAKALEAGLSPERADVPPSVQDAIRTKLVDIRTLAERMRGIGGIDHAARNQLQSRLARRAAAAVGQPHTAYVMASVDRAADPMVFREAVVLLGGQPMRARGHADALDLLRTTHATESHRWFMPGALDVLDCLADHGAGMPAHVVDPAHALFVLDPDEPFALDATCPSAGVLPPALISWLEDAERNEEAPAGFGEYIEALPQLDLELATALDRVLLRPLVEYDLALTLPVLSRMERQGAWVEVPMGFHDWDDFERQVESEIAHHESLFLPILGNVDPYAETLAGAVALFQERVRMTPLENAACRDNADRLKRLAAIGFEPAYALNRARRLDDMVRDWVRPLRSGMRRLRGRMNLTKTGRWTFRKRPLHRLTKTGLEGQFLRSALRPPPGYEMVVADFRAFEARLFAALSGDTELIAAAKKRDIHGPMATVIFGKADKTTLPRWKSALYGVSYGQGRDGFISEHPELAVETAGQTYDAVVTQLHEAMTFQKDTKKGFQPRSTASRTEGGWRRRAPSWPKAFNTLLQGYAANIFRWCLRRLDRDLATVNAFIVHQAHDEVFVAAPLGTANAVKTILEQVMEHDILTQSPFKSHGVLLFVKVEVRSTWAEGT